MSAVLVAYASKYGSTREVADAVAASLREQGMEAEVRSAREVKDASGYSTVVLGGALYYFHLLGDARRFLGRHRKALAKVPVAVFGMGPIEDTPEQYVGAREQLDKALAKHEWLEPVSVAVFGGKLDPDALRFPDNNPAMKGFAAVDLRDWDAIGEWAREVAGKLRG